MPYLEVSLSAPTVRHALLAVLILAAALPASAQRLDVVGTVDVPTMPRPGADQPRPEGQIGIPDIVGGSDVWAYTAPDGSEYAIMGDVAGISIVAVPSLEVVAHIDGPTEDDMFFHRDIKTYGSYAYVVTENTGRSEGLQVIDLSGLPARAEEVAVVRGQGDRLVSSHNLSIDTQAGFAYVLNSDASGVVVVDLDDPRAPTDVGLLQLVDLHDVVARGDTLWVAEGREPTFSVWDMADKAAPHLLARVTVPVAGYVHNIWPTDDGRFAVTTEETADKSVKVWDLSDMENPALVGEWLGSSRLAHNVHIQGDYAFLSHYASGVYVLDVSDPAAPVEVAHYDAYPANDDAAFYGTWGMSLPTASGYVYASNLEGQLSVLRWTPPAVDL